jgi:hypothetical protein
MKYIYGVVALLLALLAVGAGLVYIGSQGEHDELIKHHLWPTFLLRFVFASSLGLVGVGLWQIVAGVLMKRMLKIDFNLRKTAWLLATSVFGGAFVGAALFCFR